MQRSELAYRLQPPRPAPRLALAVAVAAAVALASLLAACGDDPPKTAPAASLRVAGQAVGAVGAYAFADAAVGERQTVSVEIVNAGDGPLTLTGSPAARVELDDALVFDARQPPSTVVPAGTAAAFDVSFTPREPGRFEGRLVIATDDPAAPELAVSLTGVGRPDPGVPALALRLDGVDAAPEGWDFGLVRIGATARVAVALENVGTGALLLAPDASVTLDGDGAAAYTVDGEVPAELAAGSAVALDVTFSPSRCAVSDADLVVRDDAGTELARVPLAGGGVSDPARFPGVLAPAGAVGAPRRVVASADGRRVVVADPTADEFTGSVAIYAFDGCDLASDDAIVPGRGGVASALVGTGVGLSDDGETLLVSARGAAQAWVFDLDSGLTTAESGPAATLGTARETAGFGASAALSGDGRIAVVGASDGSAKGAALLYLVAAATGSEDAVALPTADLGRDAGVGVGAEVAVSAGGDVVATSLLTGGSAPRAAALVWDTAVSGAWALGADGQASVVTESARLVASTGPPLDGVAHLAMARDGRTIALSAAQGGGSLLVFVFERAGATWGDASDGSVQIAETATLRLTASPAWRFALASDGSVLAGADPDGGRFFARPAGGFQTNAPGVAVEGATLRGWPTFSGGDHVIIGVAPDGALIARWLL